MEHVKLGEYRKLRFYAQPIKVKDSILRIQSDEFDIRVSVRGLLVTDVGRNASPYRFVKWEKPPKGVLDLVLDFLSSPSEVHPDRSNGQVIGFWSNS